jgi:dipeptidyl aminopeptidase/acylaminoacyl peptidase
LAPVALRAPRPEDLYRIAIPTDPRLSPDGSAVTFTVQRVGPTYDKYRTAVWLASTDGREPAHQLTIGARRDNHARWAPDGRTIAFLSDRRTSVEDEPTAPKEREDAIQVHLLPAAGPGEARRLTDLPRGVTGFSWSPDGKRLAVLSASRAADRAAEEKARRRLEEAKPGTPPVSDYRFFDRLRYQADSAGFVQTRIAQVWIVDAGSGAARRLTSLANGIDEVAWSPDGRRLALATRSARDADLAFNGRIVVADVETGRLTPIAQRPDGIFFSPTWLPDGRSVAVLGGRRPRVLYRADVRIFPADGSDPRGGRDLSSGHDVMPASSMGSDLTIGEASRLVVTDDGRWLLFLAPHRGALELWRISVADGNLERLTDGRHYLSSFDALAVGRGLRVAAIRSTPSRLPDVHVSDLGGARGRARAGARAGDRAGAGSSPPLKLRRLTDLNAEVTREVRFRDPTEQWVEVEGRQVQSWLIPGGEGTGPKPAVLEIHGGPHTLYGWSPFLEFQLLAGAGISVVYSNPRGSEGYGLEFNMANLEDWGDGPMRDVLASVDGFVAAGRVDPDRLGVTGGSYGGYLTNWIVGHTDRFRAAYTARSVADLGLLFQVGDLSGTDWPSYEYGAYPWDDPERHRAASPVTYAEAIHTPLLIQHSDRDLRTTVAQAELLFARLRRLHRPVRLMRVPDESHELTRSGTPYRRVENLIQVRDWFSHFLVAGRRRLPPKPRTRHGV